MEKKRYHHGDLRNALVEEGIRLVREGGHPALTTRACAKAVGVAPSAVFRHFNDKRALATAVAAQGYRILAERVDASMQAADENAKMAAIGQAYLAFAIGETSLFRLMFQGDLINLNDTEFLAASEPLLGITAGRTGQAGTAATDLSILAWATVHGLASLYIENQLHRQLSDQPKTQQAELMRIMGRMAPLFG